MVQVSMEMTEDAIRVLADVIRQEKDRLIAVYNLTHVDDEERKEADRIWPVLKQVMDALERNR
jgi:hypothetical protein